MKNEFVPYDIALAMKKLGFNEELCFGFYDDMDGNKAKPHISEGTNNRAILYQQAFRFLRGKNICFYISSYRMKEGVIWYRYVIEDKEYKGFLDEQEAQEDCLRKLIEIVKEKQR
jgi:hypothetical protein